LVKFTAAVGKAEIGSKQSATALSDLGISIKDFQKLTPDQQLQLVAEKLSLIAAPARRARDEVALFGKAGGDLDQTLVKIGEDGFAPFIKHMQDLGIFLDTDTIASLKKAGESFKNLGDEIKGVSTTFLVGLVPALSQATDSLVKATTQGSGGLKDLGAEAGWVLKAFLLVMETVGKGIGAVVAAAVANFQTIASAAGDVLTGQFKQAAIDLSSGFKEQINIFKSFGSDVSATFKGLFPGDQPKDAEKKDKGGAGGPDAGPLAAAVAKATLALLQARLDNQLKLYQAHAALVKDTDRQAYEDGQSSLTEYYAKRATFINNALDQEISTLRGKRKLVANEKLDVNDAAGKITQRKELEALDNEISVAELRRTGELAANTNEQSNAQRKLYEDTLQAEERLLTIAGKKTEAARLKLALDIADIDAQLRKGGVSDADRAGAEATVAGQGSAKIDFEKQSEGAQAALSQLETKRKEIEDQVRGGQKFSIQAAQEIVLEDEKRLPALQAQADEMVRLAALTKDDGDIAKAAAFKEKIDAIAASTKQLGVETAQLKAGIEGAIGAGINKFLTDAVSGTHSLKQAFTDMALSMLADLEKVAEKIIEEDALKAIFGASSGVAGATGSGWVGAIAGLFGGHAEGGHIRGPGTSTSDSIPARLSDGEFVVNAKSVSQPGILPLLTALNAGALKGVHGSTQVPKFASGGQVGGNHIAASPVNFKFVNVLDPSTLGDHLATAEGERGVLNIISKNPSRIRNSLG
jgi:hypothetical protein